MGVGAHFDGLGDKQRLGDGAVWVVGVDEVTGAVCAEVDGVAVGVAVGDVVDGVIYLTPCLRLGIVDV